MKVACVETQRRDAGWRMSSFLKLTTADGIVGWAEYNGSFGSLGLSAVIKALAGYVIAADPRRAEAVAARLRAATRQARGGTNHQAAAAYENAPLDIKAKEPGIPVYALFGGPVRERIALYWSHGGGAMSCN